MEEIMERSINNSVDWSGLKIDYNIQTDERLLLSKNLVTITKALFGNPYKNSNDRLYKQQSNLIAAFDEIGRYNASAIACSYFTVYCRVKAIQEHLSTAIPLFNALWEEVSYDDLTPWASEEGKLTRRIKKFVKTLNRLTTIPLSLAEINDLERRVRADEPAIITLKVNELNPHLAQHLNSSFESQLKGADMGAILKSATPTEPTLREWIEALSTDVLKEYNKTEEILSEVTPLLDNAEDEYFVEQIKAEYYPHIFAALRNFNQEGTDFSNKEAVVTEAVKQFKVIQLGLQRIIETTVSRHMDAMRLQTGFLRNKVLGDHSLSLSPTEADALVESSVEEAQHVRDDLYKKHVAPTLEKSKQDYDAALLTAQQDHATQLEVKDQRYAAAEVTFAEKLKSMEGQYLESQEILAQKLLEVKNKFREAQEGFAKQLEGKNQEILAVQEKLNQRVETLGQHNAETVVLEIHNAERAIVGTQIWYEEELNKRLRKIRSQKRRGR